VYVILFLPLFCFKLKSQIVLRKECDLLLTLSPVVKKLDRNPEEEKKRFSRALTFGSVRTG